MSEVGAAATELCGTRTYSLVKSDGNPIDESSWITIEEVPGTPKKVNIYIKPRNTPNKLHSIFLLIKSVEYDFAEAKVPFNVEVKGVCTLIAYTIPAAATVTNLSYTIGGAAD